MGKTLFETSDPLVKKAWDEKFFRDVVKESYFHNFMGQTKDSMVYVKEELEKKQGDKITCGLRMRLEGAGVEDDEILEGNEEALTTYDYGLTLKHYRHAVRDKGKIHRKRAMFSIDDESKMALADWGTEKIDKLLFDALQGSFTRVAYRNGSGVNSITSAEATAKAALSATNSKLTPQFISFIKTWAKTGGNRTYVPIRPIKVGGKKYYVLLVHPDALYDLNTNSDFLQAQREAEKRGGDHPIFEGATAIYQGVVIHEHENMAIATDGGGASVAWSKGALLGAQALCWAWGERPEVTSEVFDYKNQHGCSWEMIARAGKSNFNSLDFGSLGVYLARTQVSDA